MSYSVYCFSNKIRYGRSGQQNNQHQDPILTMGYVWGAAIDSPMNNPAKNYHEENYQVNFTQEGKEWRGRIVWDQPNQLVSGGDSPPLYAHVYYFVVTPKMKQSASLTSNSTDSGGDGTGDPLLTITVTNPDGTPISTPAPPTTVVQPID